MGCTGPLVVGKNGMMDTTKDLVLGGSPCLYLGCGPMKNPTFKLWLVPSMVPTVLSMGIFKQPDTSMHCRLASLWRRLTSVHGNLNVPPYCQPPMHTAPMPGWLLLVIHSHTFGLSVCLYLVSPVSNIQFPLKNSSFDIPSCQL